MYKKKLTILLLCNFIIAVVCFNLQSIKLTRYASTPAFQISFLEESTPVSAKSFEGTAVRVSSGQRVVDYSVLERKAQYALADDDYDALLRIVESEAGSEDVTGKMLVAGVVMNRVKSDRFPNTVKEVVFQKQNGTAQFSPTVNGRYEKVKISEETKEAVDRVLDGEDITRGALYFASRKYANPDKMKWFDNKLTLLFAHGGHEFFS